MNKPLTVVFKEDQTLSPDGVSNITYKKGVPHTSHTNIEHRVFSSMIEKGLAELPSEQKAPHPGQKVKKPKETK